MKTQYYTASTLDGFIATEDDSIEWLSTLSDVGKPEDASYPRFIADVGAIAMGSSTYEWIVRHAEQVRRELGKAWPYTQPAWVFTTRVLPPVEGADLRFVQGDVREVHARMRQAAGEKNIWIMGGGDLAAQFHEAGLLDELIVGVASVTLGKGKSLFTRPLTGSELQLTSVQQMGSGMAELRYTVRKAA